MKRLARVVLLAGALAAATQCGTTTGPVAGPLKVTFVTPNAGADGAILLTVTGPAALTSVTAGAGLRLFAEPLAATNHFALTGPLASGTILTIGVADVNQVGSYTATIQDVAATNFQLRPLAGYSLAVSK